jgi:hypothetical protein
MQQTDAYWIPPQDQTFKVTSLNDKKGDLGFRSDLAWPMPVTVGSKYFNEGRNELPLPKMLDSSIQGEWHAIGNKVPGSGGIPLVNPYLKEFKFKRSRLQKRFKE